QDTAFSDGAFCNGVERCDPNETGANATTGCIARTGLHCNHALTCQHAFGNGVERCDPNATGANATTGCIAGTAINCNDAYTCTQDSCDEVADTCKNVATDSLCANNSFCNPVICDPTTGAATTGCRVMPPRTCDDNYSCTDDRCDEPTRSCINTPVQARCQDGSFCNGQETCAPGT